jgi:hypothetical protein
MKFLYYIGTTPLIVHAASLDEAQAILDTMYPSKRAVVMGLAAC